MAQKINKRKLVVIILFVITICFIFYNSTLNGADSLNESNFVYDLLKPILNILLPKSIDGEVFVRKLAHFSEFALLGLELVYISEIHISTKKISLDLLIGILVAVTDETIQVFSNRGSSIIDVWIDYSGFISALMIFLLITKKHRNNENFQKRD